jgi:hypothetical protein
VFTAGTGTGHELTRRLCGDLPEPVEVGRLVSGAERSWSVITRLSETGTAGRWGKWR